MARPVWWISRLWLILVVAHPAHAHPVAKERTVTVSTSGFVTAAPDIARVSIGVITEAASAKSALARNSKLFEAVLSGMKPLGIEPKDIATEQFQVYPIYSTNKSSSGDDRHISGYRVRNSASVTVRSIANTGTVIDRAAELGANAIGAIQFEISGLEAKLDYAREEAMRNAVRRAKLYSESAGATLGEILTITEEYHGRGTQPVRLEAGSSRMAASAPIAPGEHKIGVTIHAVWKLR